jgi:hypothetical protein
MHGALPLGAGNRHLVVPAHVRSAHPRAAGGSGGSGAGIIAVLPGDLLERPAHGLRDEEGEEEAEHVGDGEDDERLPDVLDVALEREVLHPVGRDDGAGLARRGADGVAGGAHARREQLGGEHEGGAVGAEVGEEEGERVQEGEDRVVVLLEVLVHDAHDQHEPGHHEETQELDQVPACVHASYMCVCVCPRRRRRRRKSSRRARVPAHLVDEGDGDPVAGEGAEERDEEHGLGNLEYLGQGVDILGGARQLHRREDVLLGQVLAVEGDVQEEPRGGRADEVHAVAPGELRRQQRVVVGRLVPGELVLLRLDLHVHHLLHVAGRLLGVALDERGVPRRLGHLHPPVERGQRRERADHQHDAPHVVGRRLLGRGDGVVVRVVGDRLPKRRRVVVVQEEARDDHGHEPREDDADPLHGEHRGDEGAARLLVGVLGHDGRRQRVVPADAEAEPEAEEAERADDGAGGAAEGEARGDGAGGHEDERDAVDALPAELVAEVAEDELAHERADERDADDHVVDAHGQRAGLAVLEFGVVHVLVRVVEAAQQLGDGGDAEEVVGVGEEAHAGDDDGLHVVHLGARRVQRVQHRQVPPARLRARHLAAALRTHESRADDVRQVSVGAGSTAS